MTPLVLSLFPGIGLLDLAFEEHGFCVVRGPDLLWGGDIHTFHPPPGRFDGVIGGPPCQAFSRLAHLVRATGKQTAPNLIPEYERVVREAAPAWFVMENVPAAPEPVVPGYGIASVQLNNRWVGGEQNRIRRFSFGVRGCRPVDLAAYLEVQALEPVAYSPAVLASGSARHVPIKIGGSGKVKKSRAIYAADTASASGVRRSLELQGLPPDYLDGTPFTIEGKQKMIGNGVPLPMGRAVARAVREALEAIARKEAA